MTRQELTAALKLIFLAFDDAKVSCQRRPDNDWEVKASFVMDGALAHSIMTYVMIGAKQPETPTLFDEVENEVTLSAGVSAESD